MADRNFSGRHYNIRGDIVSAYVRFTIGATGAVGTTVKCSLISSITQTGTGLYRIALADHYVSLEAVSLSIESTGALAVGPDVHAEDVASTSAPYVDVVCRSLDTAFADADPPQNGIFRIKLELLNKAA